VKPVQQVGFLFFSCQVGCAAVMNSQASNTVATRIEAGGSGVQYCGTGAGILRFYLARVIASSFAPSSSDPSGMTAICHTSVRKTLMD